jgi:hypothetical protein
MPDGSRKIHVFERPPDRVTSTVATEALKDLRGHDAARAHVIVAPQQLGEGVGRG